MSGTAHDLLITLHLTGGTPEELDQQTAALREELLLLPDLYRVEHVTTGRTSEGAKSGLAQHIGTLAVNGILSAATLKAVTDIVLAWINRQTTRSATLEKDGNKLVVEGVSKADLAALVQTWITETTGDARTSKHESPDGK
ncbi:MAG TPA: hypothetical protein VIL00_00795 [Pseudonocardiaceae bacterium]